MGFESRTSRSAGERATTGPTRPVIELQTVAFNIVLIIKYCKVNFLRFSWKRVAGFLIFIIYSFFVILFIYFTHIYLLYPVYTVYLFILLSCSLIPFSYPYYILFSSLLFLFKREKYYSDIIIFLVFQ